MEKGKYPLLASTCTVRCLGKCIGEKAVFSLDGAFFSANSEKPDISTQNITKDYQKGHKSQYFNEK